MPVDRWIRSFIRTEQTQLFRIATKENEKKKIHEKLNIIQVCYRRTYAYEVSRSLTGFPFAADSGNATERKSSEHNVAQNEKSSGCVCECVWRLCECVRVFRAHRKCCVVVSVWCLFMLVLRVFSLPRRPLLALAVHTRRVCVQ